MKKLLGISALCLTALAAYSQSCPKPEPLDKSAVLGTWKGAYSLSGEFVNFTLKISEDEGVLNAKLDIPKSKVKNVAYEANICKGQELHLKNKSIGSSIEFIGRPKSNGSMSGKVLFVENGGSVTEEVFTAKRTPLVASK